MTRRRIRRAGLWPAAWLALELAGAAALAGTNDCDWGPFYRCDTDVFGSRRWQALGPLFEARQAPDGRALTAVHPLYSAVREPAARRRAADVVWPLWMFRKVGDHRQFDVLLLGYYNDLDCTRRGGPYRAGLFPVYFQGRARNGRPYVAVFPVGGVLRDFLFWNEARFILFPLWSVSRINEAETRSWLWPVVSRTRGGGHDRFRVFPIYGVTRFRLDVENKFILWPIWTSVRRQGPGGGSGFMLFPFVGHAAMAGQESWMIVPPLTRFTRSDRLREVNCPWPLFQWSAGDIDRLYFWPVWGRKSMEGVDSRFVLWPLYRERREADADRRRHTVRLIPLLACSSERAAPQASGGGELLERRLKVWPLFSTHRWPGGFRLQALSLSPFLDYEPVERNWARLWTLYTRASSPAGTEEEWLWGLVRRRRMADGCGRLSVFPLLEIERRPDGGSWSLFKGLLGAKRAGVRRTFRVGYALEW